STRVPALGRASEAARIFAPTAERTAAALNELPPPVARRWIARYGHAAAEAAVGASPDELETIGPTPTVWAELRWACRREDIVHLDDLLLRRTRLGLLLRDGGAEILPRAGEIARAELGWDDARWRAEAERYRALIARCYSLPVEA
ncbi:MAG: hypothetical protein KDJ25_11055, partial [Rhodoblastus sp.]|nr:hypothetical protein [Rhodoblastus sp.]